MPRSRIVGDKPQRSRLASVVPLIFAVSLSPFAGALGAQVAPSSQMPAPVQSTAAVGPGDRIILRVWREPSWSDTIVVGPDGTVTLPRIGRFAAAGLTPVSLADSVRTRLAVFLRDPAIDLAVLRRVAVLGAVRKPDIFYVDPVTSIRELLAKAGGIDDVGDANRIELVRGGVRQRIGKWRDVAESTAPVRSGDQVIVPRRPWVLRNALTVISSLAVAVSVLVSATR